MISLAALTAALGAVTANLLPLVSLGLNVWDLISAARQRISQDSGSPEADLAAANMAVQLLEDEVNARVTELGRLAPNS